MVHQISTSSYVCSDASDQIGCEGIDLFLSVLFLAADYHQCPLFVVKDCQGL